ncbi:hypothetical protein [uncultured Roseobacter sp.]|uniref:hypothetical protein n=1 Tax=uncultured Roseobacter sp. TaxID=114847 RepID=UPI0026125096|nr:hypothetical protein [uncultured Roseobacter sp.]
MRQMCSTPRKPTGTATTPSAKTSDQRATTVDLFTEMSTCLAHCAELVQDCAYGLARTHDPLVVAELIELSARLERMAQETLSTVDDVADTPRPH